MKKYSKEIVTTICVIAVIALTYGIVYLSRYLGDEKESVRVGFIYIGDSCDAYTNNFIKAQKAVETQFGSRVEIVAKYNVPEGLESRYIQELVDAECDVIFSTSYGYSQSVKQFAAKYPNIQFCALTGDNANVDPILPNMHNAMGEIYQGRYISGVVAGLKIKELIDNGEIIPTQAKIGYVGAFPYAEVISGYTAFLLGIRSVVPEATMSVVYTNSWGDYELEKNVTKKLIEDGNIIISQHSDTAGPAVACEEMRDRYKVFHVGYNQSMADVAPTSSLISCRINWQYYITGVVDAVINGKKIESRVAGHVHGNDISAGFDEGWVQMLKLNDTIASVGTKDKIEELINGFKAGKISVYKGNYKGVNPYDATDVIDLNVEYKENKNSSSPQFHYVIDEITIVEEW